MKIVRTLIALLCFTAALCCAAQDAAYPANYARAPRFKALLFYSDTAEPAHVDFASQAIDFFSRLTYGDGWILETTTDLDSYSYESLTNYSVIIAINAAPMTAQGRANFEKYMENGGGWLGFHAAAYNDRNTKWPWLNKFLGCGSFYCNNWPPQCVLVDIEKTDTPVTHNIPASFVAPESEWYQWNPSPRDNADVEILASISPKNYPLGIKDVISFGDFPIVWRNKNYRMVYVNYGHGDREFTDATQNLLTLNAFRYVVSMDPKGDPFKK
ncbi:MAG: ThuA domain-containing protein [Bacteroidales bacterium]|nr:ThuA domain-containing protein [Bacteroidales bacterium]